MSDIKTAQEDVEESHSSKETQVITKDADEAAKYANDSGETAYTRKEEVRLRWKLDIRLVPLLWFNVCLGAADKVTTSTAALYGMKTDANLTGDRYSWVGSVFYVSIPESSPA